MEESRGFRILAVTGRPPSPAIDGDRIANLGLLTALSQVYSVTLLTVGDAHSQATGHKELNMLLDGQLVVLDAGPVPRRSSFRALLRLCRGMWLGMPTRYLPGVRADLAAAASDLSTSKDMVVFLDNRFAHLVHRAKTSTVLHLHNVDGWSYAEERPSNLRARWLHTLTVRQVRSVEGRAVRCADAVTVTSREEGERLFALYGINIRAVVPSGVSVPEMVQRVTTKPIVGWIGSHSYGPNAVGLRRFLEEAWPKVASNTGAEFWIGGGNPPDYIMDMHGLHGVRVLGFVEDIGKMLSEVAVGVVPLWHGAGVKLKTLTMMAHMVPVVSTPVGAEGIWDSELSPIMVATTPCAMATAVIQLLGDNVTAARLGAEGRALVQARFSWDAVGASMRDVISTLLETRTKEQELGARSLRQKGRLRPAIPKDPTGPYPV